MVFANRHRGVTNEMIGLIHPDSTLGSPVLSILRRESNEIRFTPGHSNPE
jgi:hypothetical protein